MVYFNISILSDLQLVCILDEIKRIYAVVDYTNASKISIDIPKILKIIQSNLTSSNPSLSSGDVITRCFKLIDILFDSWPDSFIQDINTLYPIILASVYVILYNHMSVGCIMQTLISLAILTIVGLC